MPVENSRNPRPPPFAGPHIAWIPPPLPPPQYFSMQQKSFRVEKITSPNPQPPPLFPLSTIRDWVPSITAFLSG
ncbi:hypothetical protein AYI68_g3488 [Smittium mucronatum]|uniref:Uncharacterized protein n=1 Tax=Smittium mucronatum TaxID=133383 RepID=A0A1R0GZR8_9FUNG|nr:hypothetical protein AYI68_g3488 [Smittium mucronatum]